MKDITSMIREVRLMGRDFRRNPRGMWQACCFVLALLLALCLLAWLGQ